MLRDFLQFLAVTSASFLEFLAMKYVSDTVFRSTTRIVGGNIQLKADLQQLCAELPQVHLLIDQAEWSIDTLPMASLLPCLKNAVYDAEDLIDEFDYYELSAAKEKTMLAVSGLTSWARKTSANNVINGNLEVVQQRLDRIVNKIRVNLEKRSGRLTRPETTSFLAEPSILGRENEVNQLTDMIFRSNWKEATFSTKFSAPDERRKRMRSSTVSVLPIVGLGGVGKTTLAQHIYNYKSEISCFQMRIWVCASNELNMMSLTKKIIRSMGKETPIDDLEYLQSILASQFNNQSFLLVIDDLWDDVFNDNGETWRNFCASLGNADRSMILVTTRSSKVADAVCTIQPFSLLGFQNDVFWDFFKKCIFGSEGPQNNMDNDIELEYIGKSIASKLNGSPLAAKTIGCLLSMNLDTTHWMNILNTELSDLRQEETGILPALRFSYMHLPSHLKRCFSFCAVYPKGYKFHRPTLVDIWVAQGFVEPQGAMPIASIGNQYFGDLVSRSLFEKASNSFDVYIIHDLIHDMAYSVAKEECFVIKDSVDFYRVPPNVRHLSIHTSKNVDYHMLRNLCEYKKLRSLLCFAPLSDEYMVSIIDTWFSELPRIRVFYTCARVSKLPWSIGKLKHLRYLNFFDANFMELPSSFYRLYKLQFLHAPKSKINDFAKHISELPNLYKVESNSLQIDEDKIILDAAEDHGRGIRMLKYLTHFHGRLMVHNIGMVSNMADVAEAELNKMVHVRNLVLCWMHYKLCGSTAMGLHQYEQNICDADVLKSFCLPTSVKFLSISDYRGTYMPVLQEDALSQLASLDLLYCNQLVSISLNGALSNLTSIKIKVCNKLSSLNDLTPEYFHCIKRICIERCQDLAYLPSETFEGFHSLVELRVVSCPKLKWSIDSVLPCSLRKLYLARCGDISLFISSSLLTLTSLTDLSLVGCMWLTCLPSNLWSKLTALQNLEIQQCENLVSIGGPEATAQIKHVHISGCPKLDLIVQSFSKGKRKMSDIEPLVLDEVQKPEPDDKLVLQRALTHIQGFIELAEWSIHMDRVVNFIQEAKDAMYDTEGLLDELKYNDLLTINGVGQSSLLKSATHSDYPSLKQIKEYVAHLKIQMNVMGLHDEWQLNIINSMKSKIHPLPKEDKLFGRQEESKKLIDKLCSAAATHDKNQTTTGNVAVLPIVGCGGVGKTCLAQHVFSDKVVQSYFDMAIWISISDDLVEKKLINKFIWSAAEIEMRSDDLASAQRILTSGIIDGSKRFLLVLDNVQEDILGEAKDEFERLVQLLEHAKQGSKILVTTRSMKVADAHGGRDHLLQGFPKDTLSTFFKICAFGSDTSNNLRILDDIGRSIVAKLGTSPLAVKVIGRALSLNLDTRYWRSILESKFWELTQEGMDCFSALLLGYCCLPFNLRRCFSFCSIYPKGYEFDKGTLVDSWIALGLVEPDGDMIAQDAGNFCFQQLVNRAFFQEAASSSKYVLPGLLHDMARFISKNECYVIKDRGDWQKIPLNVRHLSILGRGVLQSSDLNSLCSHKKLLSLVCYDVEPSVLTPVINSLFCESTRIRMLSFISCQVKELPESIRNLKFLRYLDISSCTFDRLPASFWSLHNLEILDARNCSLKELPKDITNLTKLRKFMLKDSDHAVPFGDITKVGKLAFGQEMTCFAVGNCHGRGIGELKHMNFLHGKLEISGLMNVTSKDEAAGAELHKKVHLDTLILSWDESLSAFNKQPAGMGMDVLEGLCPNPNLQHLEIKYYMDKKVGASWFQKNKLCNLTTLSFDSCSNLEMLFFQTGDGLSPESSSGFPLLTKLSISRCRRLNSLDKFLQPQLLPALKVIKIEKCDEIISLTESFGDFIQLEEFELRQCWNLNWQKGLVLPSLLKELKLEACGDISGSTLLSCLHNLFTLITFELKFCHQVESIPTEIWSSLQSLENLVIFYCKGLKSIGGPEAIAQIKNVNIAQCPELVDTMQPFLKGTFTPRYQSVNQI